MVDWFCMHYEQHHIKIFNVHKNMLGLSCDNIDHFTSNGYENEYYLKNNGHTKHIYVCECVEMDDIVALTQIPQDIIFFLIS